VERNRHLGSLAQRLPTTDDPGADMKLSDLLLHEWRTKFSQPAALASLVAFAVILLFAAVSGRVARDARTHDIANHEAEVAASVARWLADLKAVETEGDRSSAPPWSGSPMDVTFSSALPPAPLADFAIGQSDLLPGMGTLSLWDPDVRLFSRYEFKDPVALALGAFDVSKAIVLVLPLLLIVLAFDVLSSERDAGRLGVIVAQGANLRSLFWRRLLIRCVPVLSVALLVAAVALLLNRGATPIDARMPSFVLWCACAALYSAFWMAVVAYAASRNRAGASNIMALLVCWTVLTLVVPAAVTSLTEAAYPPPSRPNYLAEAREAEIATERAEAGIAQQFFNDHPELVVGEQSQMPAYVRTAFFVTSRVDAATRPLLNAFEASASRRERTLAFLRYASPAIIAHGAFNEIAGSSAARHRQYMAQARAFKAAFAEQVAAYVVAGERLPSARATELPRFMFRENLQKTLVTRNVPALLFVLLTTVALLSAADSRVRQLDPLS
jgi:ABC-2 type transport system permease protein